VKPPGTLGSHFHHPFRTGDFNGDGKSDIMVGDHDEGVSIITYTQYGSWLRHQDTKGKTGFVLSSSTWEKASFLGDYDGNGRTELLILGKNTAQLRSYTVALTGTTKPVTLSSSPGYSLPSNYRFDSSLGSSRNFLTGDFNGDGRTDLIHLKDEHGYRIWISSGSSEAPELRYQGSRMYCEDLGSYKCVKDYVGSTHMQVTFVGDFDGDGIDDWMWVKDSGKVLRIHILFTRIKDGIYSRDWKLVEYSFADGSIARYSIKKENFQIGDFNGDGITDLVFFSKKEKTAVVWLSRGNGNFQTDVSGQSIRYTGVDVDNKDKQFYVLDVNQDGKHDLVHFPKKSCPPYFWISNGDGTFAKEPIRGNRFKKPGSSSYKDWDASDKYPYYFILADVDGSGSTDIVWAVDRETFWLLDNKLSPKIDMLTSAADGVREFALSYLPITGNIHTKSSGSTYPITDLSAPLYVVSKLSSSDGLGSLFSSTFTYTGAKYHSTGLGFLGFESRTKRDASGLIRTSTFYQDVGNHFLGLPRSDKVAYGTRDISKTDYVYTDENQKKGKYKSFFVQKTVVTETRIGLDETDTDTITKITTTLTPRIERGFETKIEHIIIDKYNTYISTLEKKNYLHLDTPWILGKPRLVTETKSKKGSPSQTRTDSYEYNNLNGLQTRHIREPSIPKLKLEEVFTHDQFGNVVSKTISGYDIETRVVKQIFEKNGRFVSEMFDEYSRKSTVKYGNFDSPDTTTDVNGLTTKFSYDPFGRQEIATHPNGKEQKELYLWCSEASTNCDKSVYLKRTTSNLGEFSEIYYDSLGREVKAVQKILKDKLVSVEKKYDAFFNLASQSQPHFTTDSPKWIVSQYDVLGRAKKIIYPDASTVTNEYKLLQTTSTNQNYQKTVTDINALEQVLTVTDHYKKQIKYTYSSWGEKVSSIDPDMNVVNTNFDERGRMISSFDSNSGATTFTYDSLGQLRHQEFSDTRWSSYQYDLQGRKSEAKTLEETVTYSYDCANAIGSVCSISSTSGYSQVTAYDQLTRPKIITQTTGGQQFVSTLTYTSVGSRLQTKTFPSGLCVLYGYSSPNVLSNIKLCQDGSSLWELQEQNPLAFPKTEKSGNGITTTHDYDDFGRLISIKSSVQDFGIKYDTFGNVISTTDNTKMKITRTFTDDDLNRLTKSTRTGSNAVSYTYSASGNIRTKSDTGTYTYSPTRPSAVVSITGATPKSFQYDTRGNMVSDGSRALEYNTFNKPTKITSCHGTTQFTYTPDQTLLTKIEPNSRTTIYVGDAFEKIISGPTTYYRHDIDGHASILTSSSGSEVGYYHFDHIRSVVSVTDSTGKVVEQRGYSDFGERRDETTWKRKDYPCVTTDPLAQFPQGYTSHLDLLALNYVHMKGRLYDPEIGRFLSVDVVVQEGGTTQSLNAYIYVLNNPHSIIDPSGKSWIGRVTSQLWKGLTRVTGLRAIHKGLQRSAVLRQIGLVLSSATGQWYIVAAYNAYITKITGGSEGDIALAVFTSAAPVAINPGLPAGATSSFPSTMKEYAHEVISELFLSARQKLAQWGVAQGGKKIGVSPFQANLILTGASFVGGERGTFVRENGGIEVLGWQTRQHTDLWKSFGDPKSFSPSVLAFDAIDTALLYQGLPSASGYQLILTGNLKYIEAGHSLGSLEVHNLRALGFIQQKTQLYALPAGNIAPGHAFSLYINHKDGVTGFGLNTLLNFADVIKVAPVGGNPFVDEHTKPYEDYSHSSVGYSLPGGWWNSFFNK